MFEICQEKDLDFKKILFLRKIFQRNFFCRKKKNKKIRFACFDRNEVINNLSIIPLVFELICLAKILKTIKKKSFPTQLDFTQI